MSSATKPARPPARIRLVPAPAGWSIGPSMDALDALARLRGHQSFSALVTTCQQRSAQAVRS